MYCVRIRLKLNTRYATRPSLQFILRQMHIKLQDRGELTADGQILRAGGLTPDTLMEILSTKFWIHVPGHEESVALFRGQGYYNPLLLRNMSTVLSRPSTTTHLIITAGWLECMLELHGRTFPVPRAMMADADGYCRGCTRNVRRLLRLRLPESSYPAERMLSTAFSPGRLWLTWLASSRVSLCSKIAAQKWLRRLDRW